MSDDQTYRRVEKTAIQCLLDEDLPVQLPIGQLEGIKLLGSGAICDSLGLVRYLLSLEESISQEFDTPITLMDERAMSQSRSPFRNLAVLIDFIVGLLPVESAR